MKTRLLGWTFFGLLAMATMTLGATGDPVLQGGSTRLSVNSGYFDITSFGASPSETASNNTTYINNAIDAAEAVNGAVYVPGVATGSAYGVSGELTINAGIKIYGDGGSSYIISNDGTEHVFAIRTDESVIMEKLQIAYQGAVTPNSGVSCIYVTDTNGDSANTNSHFYKLRIVNGNYGIHFYRAAFWTVSDCRISGIYDKGIFVENWNNSDQGDSLITGCTLTGRSGSDAGIAYYSSGGLKIVGNKLLGSYDYNIDIYGQEHGGSGGLNSWVISGNSIEGAVIAGVRIRDDDSLPNNAVITGNEITEGILFAGSSNVNKVFRIVVSGNALGGTGLSQSSVVKVTGGNAINIVGNNMRVDGSATYGVEVVSGADIFVSGNLYFHCAAGDQTTGSAYGYRDNNGTLQYKNEGGSWTNQ